MINDRLVTGSCAGMLAAIGKTSLNYLFYLAGVTRHTYPSLIAMILFNARSPFSFSALLIGFIVDSVIGGTVGILVVYLLKIVGGRYLWVKGIIFGNFIWLVGPVFVLPHLHQGFLINFHFVSLVDHILLGLITVLLIQLFFPVEDPESPRKESKTGK